MKCQEFTKNKIIMTSAQMNEGRNTGTTKRWLDWEEATTNLTYFYYSFYDSNLFFFRNKLQYYLGENADCTGDGLLSYTLFSFRSVTKWLLWCHIIDSHIGCHNENRFWTHAAFVQTWVCHLVV